MNINPEKIRCGIARWLLSLSVELLAYALVLIIATFIRAAHNDMIPEKWWDDYGNHGPWRHYHVLRDSLDAALLKPVYASCAAFVSAVIRPTMHSKAMLAVCVATFFVLIYYFYWLID